MERDSARLNERQGKEAKNQREKVRTKEERK
jgi:hypothetical protein